jgi:retron-type reverse transcriptase
MESRVPPSGDSNPLLINLFLHYTFYVWIQRNFPVDPFEQYADALICHCHNRCKAEQLMEALK